MGERTLTELTEEEEVARGLLPCPFCGGRAVIERKGSARVSMQIACTNCGCRMESGDVYGMTPPGHYSWNQRWREP